MEDMTEQQQLARAQLERQQIDHRWGELHALEHEYAQAGLRFLFLANAGGAIATLSFIGASATAASESLVKWTLISFVVGVVLYGVSVVFLYFRVLYVYSKYRIDANNCLKGETTFTEISAADIDRSKEIWLDYAPPLLSFLCFIAGCVCGGIALFP